MKAIMAIFFSAFLAGCGSEYVRFQRIQWNYKLEKYVSDDAFSKHYQENMIYVLAFFDEEYHIDNDVLYISKILWNDKERLWNYCRKADDEWVNERKKMFQELEKRHKSD
jgi:hypothetical protein